MNRVLVLLFACCVLGIHAVGVEVEDSPLKEDQDKRVTREIFSLIEVAIKVAQYTETAEKRKALGWVQEHLDAIKEVLNEEEADSGDEEPEVVYYEDCAAVNNDGYTESGQYNIYPNYPESTEPLAVWCDQETDGGGWTVFQRRVNGTGDFERTWDEYSQGFGDLSVEFWLGNEHLVELTRGDPTVLRVEITDWDDRTAFTEYNTFVVEGDRYTMTVEGYQEYSTAGDALDYHNGMDFTTTDQDNDRASGGNCAIWMRSGFWHNYCLTAGPNGPYLKPGGEYGAFSPGTDQGVTWTTYTGHGYPGREYSLKGTEMKLRKPPAILP